MTLRPPYVSVLDPVGPALDWMKTVLFRPFDLGRWFVIGFCAWLAQLGERGGGGGGGGGRANTVSWQPSNIRDQARHEWEQARDFAVHNLDWLIPVVVGVFVFAVGLWLLILWLNSRGRFMFLHCVAQNKAEVVNPWHQFGRHGNSLFAFRIVLGLITFVVAVAFLVLIGLVGFVAKTRAGFNYFTITGIVSCSLLFLATIIISAVVSKFTKDFVTAIMYRQTYSSVAAWHVLLDVLAFNKARFFLYLLFQIVIDMACAAIVVAAACLTCGCGCCLFLLPYIGSVALLPISVFQRSYSLYYLAQFGPEFHVIAPAAVAPPPVVGPRV